MAKIQGINHGPTLTVTATSAIVAGTTSGYTEFAAFGPVQIITAAVFNTACVMVGGTAYKPDTSTTYPAGFTMRKYFTTIQIDSGSIEMVGLKELPDLDF